MTNHYHLLIETIEANLSRIMHYLNTSYVSYYNYAHKKCGHLFQGRYKSIVVDRDSYFLNLTGYIHLNPVKAKIVEHPRDYKWSSYRGYVIKKGDGIIDKNRINAYMDMGTKQYERYVLEMLDKEENFQDKIYAGCILGKMKFIKETLQGLKVKVESEDFSFRKELNNGVTGLDEIVNLVAENYGMAAKDLYIARKQPLKAKKVALYLLKKFTALTNKEIGKAFGISYSAVSKAAGNIGESMDTDVKVRKEINSLISHFKG
jgi:hypothetical protein